MNPGGKDGVVIIKASSPRPAFSTVFLKTSVAGFAVRPSPLVRIWRSILRLLKSSSVPFGPCAAEEPHGPSKTPAELAFGVGVGCAARVAAKASISIRAVMTCRGGLVRGFIILL